MPDTNQALVENLPFDQMVCARTKAWKTEYDDMARPRLVDAVTLTYRKRGDYFGYLYTRTRGNSQWRDIKGTGMVTYPVVGRSIRSKIATSVSTRIQTEVEAVRDLPEKEAGAEIAKSILKYAHENNWTKSLDAQIAELCQIQRFCWVYNNYEPAGGLLVDIPLTQRSINKIGDTVYTCANCGFQHGPDELGIPDFADQFKEQDLSESDETDPRNMGLAGQKDGIRDTGNADEKDTPQETAAGDTDDQQQPDYLNEEGQQTLDHTADLPCPNCDAKALVLDSRARHEYVDGFTGEYEKRDCGFLDTRTFSPLLTRIDSYPCTGFQYKRAGWFNYHPLVPVYELLSMAPHLRDKIQTGTSRWSESARWHFELNNNTSYSQGYAYNSRSYQLDELVEPEIWWVAPQACAGWVSPEEWELPVWKQDVTGTWIETEEALFTINEGETIEQAVKRETKQDFTGLLLIMWGEEVIAVGNQFFDEKILGIPWKVDGQSFYPQGEENLLKLQDAATRVLSLVYSHTVRTAVGPLVVDPLGGFDQNSVENKNQPGDIIYRKPVSADVTNQDWRHFLGYLEPGPMSAAVQYFITLIIDIAKEESGVFNETVGNTETSDETLGGRRMALTQSLGLMTPIQQAKAMAMIEFDYIVLEQWQKSAPDEAFTLVKGTFEEEWKPQDIEAFRSLDVRRELFVTVVEGTDVPKTQSEMEERYVVALNAGLFMEPNQLPIQVREHIIKSVLGIDFDLGNYNAFKRLAAVRYKNMKQELAMVTPNEAFTILPDAMGNPTRQLRPEIVASLLQDVRTAPRDTDEHLVFIEYLTDQLNGLLGAKEPDEVLIAGIEKTIDTHRAFVAAKAVQANAVAGVAEGAGQQMSGQSGGMMPPPPAPAGQGAPAGQ